MYGSRPPWIDLDELFPLLATGNGPAAIAYTLWIGRSQVYSPSSCHLSGGIWQVEAFIVLRHVLTFLWLGISS